VSIELDLTAIADRIRARDTSAEPDPRAAVAAVLRPGPDILFIRRAEHPKDPWSGHMAFPGGRRDPTDDSLEHTARRETFEEVGLDLGQGQLLGPLDDMPTFAGGLVVRPYVWLVEDPRPLTPNHEVSAVSWTSLSTLESGAHDTTYPLQWKGQHHEFPGYDVGPGIVWGLTYRMLHALFETLRTG